MLDPYKTLGITSSATQEEIKKSYRKMAKKFHPDLNPGNKEAEKKFKDISHAFDLIGTPEARMKYDRGETDEQQQRAYEDFMKGQQQRKNSFYESQRQGGRYAYSFGEDFGGEDFFDHLFGGRGRQRRETGDVNIPGEDSIYRMEVDFREAALGGEKKITLPTGKTIEVKIPAGIDSGKKLRFRGLGDPGIGGGQTGDVYIEIVVRPDSFFRRKGKDIEVEVPISFMEAITGGEIRVRTLDGEVMLNVPPGVSTGSRLRMKGKGAGPEGQRGDQITILKVVTPKHVDPGLKDAVENLKRQYDYNPRMQQ